MVGAPPAGMSFAQVAYVVPMDTVGLTMDWYATTFGFLPAGATDRFGQEVAHLQQLPVDIADVDMGWMVDKNRLTQIELFAFRLPESKALSADWTPYDIGYTTVGLQLDDFDTVLSSLDTQEIEIVARPNGIVGHRRAAVRDPNGIYLELFDADPGGRDAQATERPEVPVAIRTITVSVPDLAKSIRFFGDTLGLPQAQRAHIDHPDPGTYWGQSDPQHRSVLFSCGPALLEVREYAPGTGKPHTDDHLLSDHGIMNIALATQSRSVFDETFGRVRAAGYERRDFIPDDTMACSYVTDDQGINAELIYLEDSSLRDFGFEPLAET